MKDPVRHTVQLQRLLNEYNRIAAGTFNPDRTKALSVLIQMKMLCELAIEDWQKDDNVQDV